ncbi:MAG: hypothetical protein WD883_00775 [Candidatus Colwellbacteria bacterium]
MATSKKRLNISLAPEVDKAISELAKRDGIPQATKAANLLRIGLEVEEDFIFDKIATARYKEKGPTLSHNEVWKK